MSNIQDFESSHEDLNFQLLIDACIDGDLNLVKNIHSCGTDITACNNMAVRRASRNGHLDVVTYLHENGADIYTKDNIVFRRACRYGHLSVVKYLYKNGANIYADQSISLQWAAQNGHMSVVKFLLKKGLNIHANKDGAVRWASYKGRIDVVKYLHSMGANIMNIDQYEVVTRGCIKIIKYLRKSGLDVYNDIDEKVSLAIRYEHLDLLRYFLQRCSELNISKQFEGLIIKNNLFVFVDTYGEIELNPEIQLELQKFYQRIVRTKKASNITNKI